LAVEGRGAVVIIPRAAARVLVADQATTVAADVVSGPAHHFGVIWPLIGPRRRSWSPVANLLLDCSMVAVIAGAAACTQQPRIIKCLFDRQIFALPVYCVATRTRWRPLSRRRFRQCLESGRHGSDRRRGLLPQSVAFGKPTWIVVGQPGVTGCILPNQYL
jgi:hypothetical protein